MISAVLFYTLLVIGGVGLGLLLYWVWPDARAVSGQRPAMPATPQRKRSQEPQPFAGLTTKPHGAACEQRTALLSPPPPAPPESMPVPNRRRRQVDTSKHCCPHAPCAYRGWVGLGNLRANRHPNGGPGRQGQCTAFGGYVLETHGTRLHGKRVSAQCRVRVIACLAEGLGSRGTARVFEVDPNTVLQWLGEAADQLQAIACAICTSGRSNWTNCTPCSVTSRTVTSVRTKRLSTCQAHRTG